MLYLSHRQALPSNQTSNLASITSSVQSSFHTGRLGHFLLLTAAVVLAIEPIRWLIGTWISPGYSRFGMVCAALVAGIGLSSVLSPLTSNPPVPEQRAIRLLLTSSVIRLLAQILGINVLGGAMLALDVYALGMLLRLPYRRFPIAPFWLACLFLFCLPIEPIAQRLCGYALQHLSAVTACGMLSTLFTDLLCQGVHLQLNSRDVLVDLPCSGARLLTLTGAMFCALGAIRRPCASAAFIGVCVSGLAIITANSLRISLLAVGLAYPETLGVNVMEQLPHTLIGLVGTGLTALVLYRWSISFKPNDPVSTSRRETLEQHTRQSARQYPRQQTGRALMQLLVAVTALIFSIVVVNLTPAPLDARPPSKPPDLPLNLAGLHRSSAPLTDLEETYYTQYGGSAARARYGPFALLVVETFSPLRHLHDPALCMSGMGFEVQFLGTDSASATSRYRATGSDKQTYTIEVSYLNSASTQATSISEVVWRWLQDPDQRWRMIQKIIPDDESTEPALTQAWRQSTTRAFNLKMET